MKTLPNQPVTHDWVHLLTFQQQALLMTGMRGPDNSNKHNTAKAIVRYLRGCVLRPAGDWKGGNDNDFMWGNYDVFPEYLKAFWDDHDGYPHHFIMHLVHCAEIVGYKHPDEVISFHFRTFYEAACDSFHMELENSKDMDMRLNDFNAGVPNDLLYEDLQDQVKRHVREYKGFAFDEAFSEYELTFLYDLMMTFIYKPYPKS